jgi:hypothetical protein
MTRPHAAERPSASKLRLKFNTIRNRLTASQMRTHLESKDITDPLRERLLALGIEFLLDSETDDSPEQSSSEAPTTGNSNRSHDSYWSVDPSLDSSITSQSSVEQGSHGPFHMITSALSRARSPARANSKGPDSKPSVWKPAKMADRQRSPSPTPILSEPQTGPKSPDDMRPSARSTSPKPRGPYLRTGKFPWSRSSSPDSAGSPILAVVNQFLAPEASGLYGGDGFDYGLGRPYDNQKDWSQNTYASTYAGYGPSPNELPPQQAAAPPVTATQNAAATTQQSAPGRNRRNTVSTAKPISSFDNVAPSSFMSPPQGTGAPAKGGWGTINSIYEEPEASYGQSFYGEQGPKSTPYGKFNKSVNALPLSLNQTKWEPAAPQKETISIDQFNNSPVDFWGTDNITKPVTEAPPKPAAATKPVEKRETLAERLAKAASKKTTPSSQLASSSPPKPTNPPTRPSLATTAVNRKSTIGVEDATPYNTPPKTTIDLPPPTNPSPTTTKVKKSKSKKGSISEMPKENEKEKTTSPTEDPFSLRTSPEEISTIRGKRRGSGASNTVRPTSPFSSLFGSKPVAEPAKDVSSKPSAPKPSFKSTGFGWGSKPKFSPPADTELGPDIFSFASFAPKAKANDEFSFNPSFQKLSTSTPPATSPFSDEEASSQPVPTPPSKSGWKTKSYFPPTDAKPAASSPKEEEDDLARLVAQMAYPNNTPRFSTQLQEDLYGKSNYSFGFNDSAFDNAREDSWSTKAKPGFTAFKNDRREQLDAAAATPTFAAAKPTKLAPETKGAAGKIKKVGKFPTKSTIAVESPVPTPTTEAEDPWGVSVPAKKNVSEPPKAQYFESNEQQEAYSDWFSVPGGFPAGGDAEYDAVAEPELAEEENDPWFAPEVKSNPKITAAPAAKPVQSAWGAPSKLTKAKKNSRFAFFDDESAGLQEGEDDVTKDDKEFKVVEEEVKGPLAKAKKAKATKEPERPKKTPPTSQPNKWSAWGMDVEEPNADEEDLAAELAATLDTQIPSQEEPVPSAESADKEAEKEEAAAASKATTKANPPPPKGKAKKKGKR